MVTPRKEFTSPPNDILHHHNNENHTKEKSNKSIKNYILHHHNHKNPNKGKLSLRWNCNLSFPWQSPSLWRRDLQNLTNNQSQIILTKMAKESYFKDRRGCKATCKIWSTIKVKHQEHAKKICKWRRTCKATCKTSATRHIGKKRTMATKQLLQKQEGLQFNLQNLTSNCT